MKKYDLHIHSIYSKCSMNKPDMILKRSKKTELWGLAITDHNTIKGAKKIKKMNRDKELDIIIGSEIKTDQGEIIGLYLNEEIKSRVLLDVIDEIKGQDGIMIIPHPFRFAPWQRFKYPLEKLKGKVDAIEVFNSRNFLFGNTRAKKANKNLNYAEIGASDAHIPLDIGKGYTLFEGDLRNAIRKKKTAARGTVAFGILSAGISAINKRIINNHRVVK
jgi:predicted metal-dependent phosphoesterase TrpH